MVDDVLVLERVDEVDVPGEVVGPSRSSSSSSSSSSPRSVGVELSASDDDGGDTCVVPVDVDKEVEEGEARGDEATGPVRRYTSVELC